MSQQLTSAEKAVLLADKAARYTKRAEQCAERDDYETATIWSRLATAHAQAAIALVESARNFAQNPPAELR